jgi:hypothetical protein
MLHRFYASIALAAEPAFAPPGGSEQTLRQTKLQNCALSIRSSCVKSISSRSLKFVA